MKRSAILVCVIFLVTSSCSSGDEAAPTTVAPSSIVSTVPAATTTTTTTTITSAPTQPPVVTTVSPLGWTIDAGLELRPFVAVAAGAGMDDPVAPYPGPTTPGSLNGVTVSAPVAELLEFPGVREMLEKQGFAVVPGTAPLFHRIYEPAVYDPFPVYVTTDSAYHSWHLVFDKILREIEQQVLLPILDRLVVRLVEQARLQRQELTGTPLEDAADRATQFYEVAATVLGLDVGPIGPLAVAEVQLVLEAAQMTASPVASARPCTSGESPNNCVDYSLFKPRGHYTRNEDLTRYFRAMSVLGNSAFFLDAESLRRGMMASRVLLSDQQMVRDWQAIYEPTAFLVGAADDYTPFELAAAAAQITPDGLTAPLDFAEDVVVDEVARELLAARQVQIDPGASSVRIMGVRFVLDSYIYDQLLIPNVAGRWEASPLDMAAAFGSEWAYDTLENQGMTAFDGYDDQMEKLRGIVAARQGSDWSATVYDAWLYALEPMWAPQGDAFPDYMRSDAWTAKSHQTGLGSYTELKHDTILYSKQAIAEGGGDIPDSIRHWVEPDPAPFARLGLACELMRIGLAERGLLPGEYEQLLEDLEAWLEDMRRIATAELSGEPIAADDLFDLIFTGGYLEAFWLASSDWEFGEDSGPDSMAALIADILRNPTHVLELGTGYVDTLLVVVPDGAGGFEVAMGGVYSYYEFWQEATDRLTDEQWRALLAAGVAPERLEWQRVFLPGD